MYVRSLNVSCRGVQALLPLLYGQRRDHHTHATPATKTNHNHKQTAYRCRAVPPKRLRFPAVLHQKPQALTFFESEREQSQNTFSSFYCCNPSRGRGTVCDNTRTAAEGG